MILVDFGSLRVVGCIDNPFARTGAAYEIGHQRINDLQSVTDNGSPLWIDRTVVYHCLRATSESIADYGLGCFNVVRCFVERGCATMQSHNLQSFLWKVEGLGPALCCSTSRSASLLEACRDHSTNIFACVKNVTFPICTTGRSTLSVHSAQITDEFAWR